MNCVIENMQYGSMGGATVGNDNQRQIMRSIAFRYRETNQRILDAVIELSDGQLRWQPAPDIHSIGFVVWHVARYADLLQATVPRMTPNLAQRLGLCQQIWEVEQLAQRWGWQGIELGHASTGKAIADAGAAQLPLPHRDDLLHYLRRTFVAAVRAVDAVDDYDLLSQVAPEIGIGAITVGDSLLANLVHNNQHLGEILCLRSLQRHNGRNASH